MSCKIITLASHKGGTCKTTLTTNLACLCAQKGNKVLMLDFDAQANVGTCFKMYDELIRIANNNQTLSAYLKGKTELKNCLTTDFNSTVASALKNSKGVLYTVYGDREVNKFGRTAEWKGCEERLEKALDYLKSKFDYIFIDTAPSVEGITPYAWKFANLIVVPIDSSYDATSGAITLYNSVQGIYKKPMLVVSTKVQKSATCRSNIELISAMSSVNQNLYKANAVISYNSWATKSPSEFKVPQVLIPTNKKQNERFIQEYNECPFWPLPLHIVGCK